VLRILLGEKHVFRVGGMDDHIDGRHHVRFHDDVFLVAGTRPEHRINEHVQKLGCQIKLIVGELRDYESRFTLNHNHVTDRFCKVDIAFDVWLGAKIILETSVVT
jgi:hypothetical protein